MFKSPVLRGLLVAALLFISWTLISRWDQDRPTQRVATVVGVAVMLLFALALVAPRRFAWIYRVLAGVVFLSYAGYFAHQVWRLLEGDAQSFRPGRPSAVMAGLGLLILGVPCLIFALSGLGPSEWATGRQPPPDDPPTDGRGGEPPPTG